MDEGTEEQEQIGVKATQLDIIETLNTEDGQSLLSVANITGNTNTHLYIQKQCYHQLMITAGYIYIYIYICILVCLRYHVCQNGGTLHINCVISINTDVQNHIY